ncbi:fibronectin type III domain-containing protein [Paenibacillus roseipurpureus]|uniref:Fibronectin type III domain-containing protein n=1 Tax=Paenibacillus roseopurpureus TaxID=2918901 RepID=A0AA96LSR1_9BACL|nr:fibronectin type III domain-containing protein [Paenibacillus sp. MBLB1832]WNR45238.1 fibronectin type III domain-containing protein [Paenibacillus sp. MBLB1832]
MRNTRLYVSICLTIALFVQLTGISLFEWNIAYAASNAFYVSSTDGNDSWSGTLAAPNAAGTDGPLKTLGKAKSKVNSQIAASGMNGDIYVYIKGVLENVNNISFGPTDSGVSGFDVVYTNYPGEQAAVTGSTRLTGWTLDSGNVYKKTGVNWTFHTLYENGVRAVKARYPNQLPSGANAYSRVADKVGTTSASKSQFIYASGDIPSVSSLNGLEVFIWPGSDSGEVNWKTNTISVSALDTSTRQVTLSSNAQYTIGAGSRYFVQGKKELLDAPGEFYLDDANDTLYYWPRSNTDIESLVIEAPKSGHLLGFYGSSDTNPVHNIRFEGITIKNTDRDQDTVYIKYAKNITIKNNEIYNSGLSAIELTLWAQNNVITGNHMYNLGYSGIKSYANSSTSVQVGYNEISNNYIHDVGQLNGEGSGIFLDKGAFYTIKNNRIFNASRWGISIYSPVSTATPAVATTDAQSNIIEYNDISNVNNDSQDTGAIYAFGMGPNNIIRNNIIHDNQVAFSFASGIYLDDDVYNTSVYNNILYNNNKQGNGPFTDVIAKGTANKFYNNIIADNDNYVDYGPGAFDTNKLGNHTNKDIEVTSNIVYNSTNQIYTFINWQDDRYAKAENNTWYNANGIYGTRGMYYVDGGKTIEDWRHTLNDKYDQFSLTTDPLFVNAGSSDYRLRYDSPSYGLGFVDFNMEDIGLTSSYPLGNAEETLDRLFVRNSSDSVNDANLSLNVNATAQLSLKGRTTSGYIANLSNATVSYASNNTTVATVSSSGLITAKAAGVAKITTTVTKGGVTKTADMYVIVADALSSLSIAASETGMTVGGTVKLQTTGVTTQGQKLSLSSVSYSSSNTSVATVSSQGVVTGVATGTATITASAAVGGVTKNATINVGVYSATLKSISINFVNQMLQYGGTDQITVTGTLSDNSTADLTNATKQFSIDSTAATVNATTGAITAGNAPGSGRITVKVTLNGVTRTAADSVVVYGTEALPTGWNILNVGSAIGAASYSNNRFHIATNGNDINGSADDGTIMYQNVSSMNFSVVTRIDNVSYAHPNAAAGPVIREDTTAGSKSAFIRLTADGGGRLLYRTSAGGSTSQFYFTTNVSFPADVKLERNGDTFIASYWENGNWKEQARATITMNTAVKAGLGTISHDPHDYSLIDSSYLCLTTAACKPMAPIQADPVAGDTQIKVSWGNVDGATGYKVKYGTTSGSYTSTTDVGNVTSKTLTGLTNNTTYYIIVTAYNATGESIVSNEESLKPVASPAPSAPVLNAPSVGSGQVSLNWSAVSGATGYKVKYGIASGSHTTTIDVGSVTSYTVTGLTNGTTYYFVVTAYSSGGESSKSNEKTAIPSISAPVQANPTAGNAQITVNWGSVTGATGYKVKYGTSSGTYSTTVDAGNVTSKTITGLTNGTTYYLVVTAYNATAESAISNEKSATPSAPPAAPIQTTPIVGSGQITVNWNSVSGATSYNVKYGTSSGTYATTVNAGNVTSYTVSGLTNGTTYYFVVTAQNGSGESTDSNQVSAVPQIAAPVQNNPTPGNGQITVNWSAVGGATGYHVKYGTTSGSYATTVDAGNVTSYTINSLTNGTTYFMVVTAYNATQESTNSNEKQAIPTLSSVTLNKTATASGSCSGTQTAAQGVDGSTTTKWCHNVAGDKWLMVDLGQNYDITRWVVKHAGAGGESTSWNTKDFKLQRSQDGTTWTDVDSVVGNTANVTDRTVTSSTFRYARLYITNSGSDNAARIYEFELYGVTSPPDTQAPSVPTGLTTTSKTATSVTMSWTASTDNVGVSGYDVYNGSTKVNSANISSASYTVTGLTASTSYSLTVKANDAAGNASTSSSALNVTTNASSVNTTNLALSKTATASGSCAASQTAAQGVDGSTTTKWCHNTSGAKWLQLDLGQYYDISRWVVKHAGAGGESTSWNTKDFKLQKSEDGTTWTDVDSVVGNTANVTDRTVTLFATRYIRLYITNSGSDSAARIFELELY